jgi:hypothetical protein
MAQNAEHQNLDRKLKAEWDTEGIAGTAETAWEKMAVGMETAWEKAVVGKKTETETEKTMAQMEKTMVEMQKRTVGTQKTAEGTRKTTVVNEKTEWESLYQNHHNTHQMDGRTILYNLKQKKTNREQEQRLVY